MSTDDFLRALPGTHAYLTTPGDDVGPSGRTDMIVIAPMMGRPRPTLAANAARARQKASNRAKARTLRGSGLSIARIALKMKRSTRTVERYLEPEKPPA